MRGRSWLVIAVAALTATLGSTEVTNAAPSDERPAAKGQQFADFNTFVSRYSGRCLDVANGSVRDEANVHQWACEGVASQSWRFMPTGDGYFYIVAKHSDLCLDVDTRAANGDYGGNVHQYHCWGGRNQQWRLDSIGDGYYYVVARHNNKCLDVDTRPGNVNGANVHNWTCWGGNNQMWKINPV
ncbi:MULTISPECIES: RICIN domain-containing protein [Streptomyces]|uniref:RICIN domain-containing protein n=1 Tax=Streptomyces TaxID=1883 RepID=UPI00345B690B